MGRQPKSPNDQLKALVAEAGLSNKGLARRVIQQGKTKGFTELRYNHSSVARWFDGEQPQDGVPELIAQALAVELGRVVTVTDIGMTSSTVFVDVGLELDGDWAERVGAATALWRADVERRQFLTGTALAASASSRAALRWLTSPPVEPPLGTGLRRIGAADVEAIREMTRTYRELDNRLGGGRLRTVVVHQLDSQVTPMLRNGRYSDEIGRRLAGAAAELGQLAGWLAYDCELHGLGQRYLLQALSLAQTAGDSALCGEIMAAISHQSVYLAQSATAIDLARTGQAAARRAGLPTLMTECLVMEAHGHAARDDARACAGALVRAEKSFDSASRSNVPAWLSYFDAAYLAAKFGQCFRDMGQGAKAEEYARRSLNMDGRYARGKAFNQTLLAVAYAQQKQVDQACHEGRIAVDLVAGLSSQRAVRYVKDLRRRLEPYGATKAVREFNEYAVTRLPALQPAAGRAEPQ